MKVDHPLEQDGAHGFILHDRFKSQAGLLWPV